MKFNVRMKSRFLSGKKLAIVLAFTSFFFASCTKNQSADNGSHTSTTVQRDINVEYRITNVSANVSIEYIAPANGTANLTTQTMVISKTYSAIQFASKSNNFFSIAAKNMNMSTQDITVDIYVDGVLFKSGSLDHLTMTALASGKVE
jgi:hypothetical protein